MKTLLLLVLSLPVPALACTLWGAAGDDVGGGTLISKNRDWAPDHRQVFKRVIPQQGFVYAGLFAEGNNEPGIKAGVNEKGLTIVSASSNVPKKLRDAQTGTHGVMRKILSEYASVAQVMANAPALFGTARPNYYLISDRQALLMVEVGLEGRFTLKESRQGVVAHTNHYLDPALPEFIDFKAKSSSASRLSRIDNLLIQASRPLDISAFQAMSRDQHAGPDHSLWRTGNKTRTLASWIIRTPASGAPSLSLIVANPGEAQVSQNVVLDAHFWSR